MVPTRSSRWIIRGVILATLAAGCSSSNLHPIHGRVHFPDGQPLKHGIVILDTGSSPTGSWGSIRDDGTFEMGSKEPNDGVPAGTWRVCIDNARPQMSDADPNPKSLIHARFTNPATSGFVFTVPDQTTWELVVERP